MRSTVSPCCQPGVATLWPELSKPFCEPGAPCKSMITLMPTWPAQLTPFSRKSAAPLAYGESELSNAQYPTGILTRLKPLSLIFSKSESWTQFSQWGFRTSLSALSAPSACVRVYSSTMPRELSNCWKIEGVIQGSSTSQPPILTPRTFSPAQENGASRSTLRSSISLFGNCQPQLLSTIKGSDSRRGLNHNSGTKRNGCVSNVHDYRYVLVNMEV